MSSKIVHKTGEQVRQFGAATAEPDITIYAVTNRLSSGHASAKGLYAWLQYLDQNFYQVYGTPKFPNQTQIASNIGSLTNASDATKQKLAEIVDIDYGLDTAVESYVNYEGDGKFPINSNIATKLDNLQHHSHEVVVNALSSATWESDKGWLIAVDSHMELRYLLVVPLANWQYERELISYSDHKFSPIKNKAKRLRNTIFG